MKKITLQELKIAALAAKPALWSQARGLNRDVKLYLHWSAGHYGQFFDDYHVNIDGDGSLHQSVEDLSETLAHTWKRNTGSIGISLACCVGATSDNLGNEPPTQEQVESMARAIAVLADALDLTIDLRRVMTHGEAADNQDGVCCHENYGPDSTCERWDLAILKTGEPWGSGGGTLRGKANWYRENYKDGVEKHFS